MVVLSTNLLRTKKSKALGIPTIDLSLERSLVSKLIVRACEEYGFFKLINHGVPNHVISRIEKESLDFFSKPFVIKQKAGPPTPFGFGFKTIGCNGDMGELEYLLLEANPLSISNRSKTISTDATKFSCVVNDYVQAVRDLSCEILDLVAQGLCLSDNSLFSRLIKDMDADSCFRVNHYPPFFYDHIHDNNNIINNDDDDDDDDDGKMPIISKTSTNRVGFGEHSDPQILTLMRSNDVGGLQISSSDGLWIPVPPNPSEFCVFVGDALQAMTNERFISVRHRVVAMNSSKPRISMMYFGAPTLDSVLYPLPQMVSPLNPSVYKPFTWREFKKAAYGLRLGDRRLDFFKYHSHQIDKNEQT